MWEQPVPVSLGFRVGLPWLPHCVLFVLHSWQCSWSPGLPESFCYRGGEAWSLLLPAWDSWAAGSWQSLCSPEVPPVWEIPLCLAPTCFTDNWVSTRAAPLTDQALLPGLVSPQFWLEIAQYVLFWGQGWVRWPPEVPSMKLLQDSTTAS